MDINACIQKITCQKNLKCVDIWRKTFFTIVKQGHHIYKIIGLIIGHHRTNCHTLIILTGKRFSCPLPFSLLSNHKVSFVFGGNKLPKCQSKLHIYQQDKLTNCWPHNYDIIFYDLKVMYLRFYAVYKICKKKYNYNKYFQI